LERAMHLIISLFCPTTLIVFHKTPLNCGTKHLLLLHRI
jgi:hypothetical protein